MDKRVGITSTIPVEVVYAAGRVPVDLNNLFITSEDPLSSVQFAEYESYPRNICAWIKGIYATALSSGIKTLIAVVEGDCSQTQAMMETLAMHDLEIIPFAFPYSRNRDLLRLQIEKLCDRLGTDWESAGEWKRRLDETRSLVWRLDELTWQEGKISGWENHYYQVCCSDFNGDPDRFDRDLRQFLDTIEARPIRKAGIRLGYIGIPTMFMDFYEVLESLGAQVVFNEVQRQFTMPPDDVSGFRMSEDRALAQSRNPETSVSEGDELVEQYARYTYPYDIFARIEDIKREIARRDIHGLIHYTQSFCFRQIQDLILRRAIDLPILTVEGEYPARVDGRTRVRIESFLEMLRR